MSRVASFRDIKYALVSLGKAPSSLTEKEMLEPYWDDDINAVLASVGFDMRQAIDYVPNLHRDIQGNVGMGYRAVGTVTTDPVWLKHPLCTITEAIIFEYRRDPGLARDMAAMLGSYFDLTDSAETTYEPSENEYTEPDCKANENEIQRLINQCDKIRGNRYNEDGSLKTPADWADAWAKNKEIL